MFFRLLQEYALSKKIKNQCIVFAVSFLVLTGTMFCLGVFYFIKDASAGLLGESSANINAFVNPQGMSRFIKDMPLAANSQYEGNAYLGLGIILFVFAVILLYQRKKNCLLIVKKEKVLPVFGIVLSFLLFSLSPVITLDQYKLFTYPVLFPIERLWSIFRSTGRMTWPVIYIIMIVCIWRVITQFSVKKSFLFLCVFLLIQWVDLMPWFISKGNGFKTKVIWRSELSSSVWNNLANEYKHLFFMDNYLKLNSFLDLAGDYLMTVNDAYLARTNQRMVNYNKQKEYEYLIDGKSRSNTIYVFEDQEKALSLRRKGLFIYLIDNVIIGIDSEKNYLDNYRF
jgi:hypothetical protein